MRKNLIPLLAVALVIAGLCTIIFYGLIADRFSPSPQGAQAATTQLVAAAKTVQRGKVLESADLKTIDAACPVKSYPACFQRLEQVLGRPAVETIVEGQPITEEVIAKRTAGASPSGVIPVGMRAVTLHAADSRGVVEMIRSGDRVDLQVIGNANPNAPLVVQRVWTNVEVLNTMAPDPGSTHNGRPVLTVLMAPEDAERLSLADTTSRIRVVLRNREESLRAQAPAPEPTPAQAPSAQAPAASAAKSPVAQAAKAPAAQAAKAPAPDAPQTAAPAASFLVRLVSVNSDKLAGLGAGNEQQPLVRALARQELEAKLAELEAEKTAHVLGSRPVSGLRDMAAALGADGQRLAALAPGIAGVRVRLRPLAGERWKVEPEAQSGGDARRSESEASLHPQQAWLVSGLLEHKEGRPVLPGQGSQTEPKLVLLITPVR